MTNPETPDAKLVGAAAEELRFGDCEGNLPDRLESLAERLSATHLPVLRWERDGEELDLILGHRRIAALYPRSCGDGTEGWYLEYDNTVRECNEPDAIAAVLKAFGLSASSVAGCAGETK